MKRILSLILSTSILIGVLGVGFSVAASTTPSTYNASDTCSDDLTPPPGLIIGPGEEWIPGAIDPLLISPFGADDECGHYNVAPEGYIYIGTVKGSDKMLVTLINTATGLLTLKLGSHVSFLICTATDTLLNLAIGDKIDADYYKAQYSTSYGDTNLYWFHYLYTFYDNDGVGIANECYRTFSPKQEKGPFQD